MMGMRKVQEGKRRRGRGGKGPGFGWCLVVLMVLGLWGWVVTGEQAAVGGDMPEMMSAPQPCKALVVKEVDWQHLPKNFQSPPPQLPPYRLSVVDHETLEKLKERSYNPEPNPNVDFSVDTAQGPSSLSPTVGVSFKGPTTQDNADASGYWVKPPDPVIAVGQSHVVAVVNRVIMVYSKNGESEPAMVRRADLGAWFNNVCPNCSPFDPQIVYDIHEGRWIMTALAKNDSAQTSYVLVSVSRTSDPTGKWWNYAFDSAKDFGNGKTWADYDRLGFDGILSTQDIDGDGYPDGAIYITTNQFKFSGGYDQNLMYILSKAYLYSGGINRGPGYAGWFAHGLKNSNGSYAFTIVPARTYGNPGCEYLINTEWANSNFVSVWRYTPSWGNGPTHTLTTYTINNYSLPPDADQPCSAKLDTIDNRIYTAVWRNNVLLAGFNEEDSGNAACRYVAIDTSAGTVLLDQTNPAGPSNNDVWFPAVDMDASGNILIVQSYSGPSTYPSVWAVGFMYYGGGYHWQFGTEVKRGEACFGSGTGTARWGDYAGACVDPVEQSRVWIIGEYGADDYSIPQDWEWATWIAQTTYGVPPNMDDEIGVYRSSTQKFYMDLNDSGRWESSMDRQRGPFGVNGDTPIVGNWQTLFGSSDRIGVYRPSTQMFYLDTNGNGRWDSGIDTKLGPFGASEDKPVVGDWDGDGVDEIGVYRPSTQMFYLDTNGNGRWDSGDTKLGPFGASEDRPVVGDWDGDGVDEIGVYRPSTQMFYLDYNNSGKWESSSDKVKGPFGTNNDTPVVGNWDGALTNAGH